MTCGVKANPGEPATNTANKQHSYIKQATKQPNENKYANTCTYEMNYTYLALVTHLGEKLYYLETFFRNTTFIMIKVFLLSCLEKISQHCKDLQPFLVV